MILNKEKTGLVNKPSLVLLLFAACFAIWFVDFWRPVNISNRGSAFEDDVVLEQYSYLPVMFLHDGEFKQQKEDWLFAREGPYNVAVPRYNYGMALLYSPFFFAAHCHSKIVRQPYQGGFSVLFETYIHWGSIFYVLLGLFLLRLLILKYFSEPITALVLFSGLFGSLLFYYTFSKGELPQGHLFFLFSLFLTLTNNWHKKPGVFNSVALGIVCGLISLIEFFELYIVLFFIFWEVRALSSLRNKLAFFKSHFRFLALILLVFGLTWLPQLLFNRVYTGGFFHDAFPGETYDFADSRIWAVLFSYKQGWIIYTPLAFLLLLSLIFVGQPGPASRAVFVLVLLVVLFFYGSSWEWGHGKYFGARLLCPAFAWLAFPYAGLLCRLFSPGLNPGMALFLRPVVLLFVFFSVCINIGWSYKLNQNHFTPIKMDEGKYWSGIWSFKRK